METEKVLCYASLIGAGLVTFIFLLDVLLGFPFGRASAALDILFIIGGAFVLWQGYETYRELR
jgi:threonine/homoserine/homoserine lactone efflux protein